MPRLAAPPYGYRGDAAVPRFDDRHALFVFDGACVLYAGGAAMVMRRDRRGQVRFATTASPLGAALFRHHGVDPDATYLLVEGGRGYTESAGYLRLARVLGGGWRLAAVRDRRAGARAAA